MKQKILILGFGYTAEYLSKSLIQNNFKVTGTTRDNNKITLWKTHDVQLLLFEINTIKAKISECSYILISIPPGFDGKEPIFSILKDSFIENYSHIKWIGYLSSTGVYGDHQGKWVNERSLFKQPGTKGRNRINAENKWMSLFNEFQLPVHIFRLSGIYGQNRNNLTRILNGKTFTVIKKGQIFSRIHVEDISKALMASIKKPTPGEIYNISDDYPCSPEKVDEYAAKLLSYPSLKHIPFEQAELSEIAKEFYKDSRKVSNAKLKTTFNLKLNYPTYKEGLYALFQTLNVPI